MEVYLIAAMTLDGYIGRSATDRSFDWTTPEDKAAYIAKIKTTKHLVMGHTTLKTIKRFPQGTICHVYTRQPDQFDAAGLSQAAEYQPTTESPEVLVARLKTQGVSQLAICGGSSIYNQFLAAGVVTKLYLTIEPILFGGGVRLFSTLPASCELKLLTSQTLNSRGSLWLEYAVSHKNSPHANKT